MLNAIRPPRKSFICRAVGIRRQSNSQETAWRQRRADAFVCREIEGLSTEEICTRLDITANNCRVLLYRILNGRHRYRTGETTLTPSP